MRRFKTIANTVLALTVLVALGGLAFVYSGVYNVAADDEHWPATRWLIHVAKERSIALRADDIRAPALGGREQLLAGADAYDQMCASCHTPPGGDDTPLAQGLYPAPPDMAHAAEEYSAAEIFWVIKHGIKATGMPAWGPSHNDAELWPIVAFLRRLPYLDGDEYRRMVAEAESAGIGHRHDGGTDAPAHNHDGHAHNH